MNKVCVLIRVYNRIEDLKYCVNIIRDTWQLLDYYVMVVSNGEKDGYIIDEETKGKIDLFVDLKENVGHYEGNSQLLIKGLPQIPEECKYTVILEADTWIYGDSMIKKYINKLDAQNAVWASAQWYTHLRTLATDFAIVNTQFVKDHEDIFYFYGPPEFHVANYLHERNKKSIHITENMPINMPRYIRRYPYAPTGRFFIFANGKMATHHVETLKGGMNEKKQLFNLVADKPYFKDVVIEKSPEWERLKMRFFAFTSYLFPMRSWVLKRKDFDPKDFF